MKVNQWVNGVWDEYTKEEKAAARRIADQKYENTEKGFLMRLYRNMQSRVTGVQKLKFHLYEGKELLGREEFYKWAKSSEDFKKLFIEYVASGYERKLAPSVDRENPELGYTLDNIRWVTSSVNSGSTSANVKVRVNGVEFPTMKLAGEYFGTDGSIIKYYLTHRVREGNKFGFWEVVRVN